jgi:phosphoribosylformylglycinamidine synthase
MSAHEEGDHASAAAEEGTYRIGVRVTLRPAVLDTQGKAILRGLHAMGFSAIHEIHAGKYFSLVVRATSAEAALAEARRACERLLSNPVIETLTLALEGVGTLAPARGRRTRVRASVPLRKVDGSSHFGEVQS